MNSSQNIMAKCHFRFASIAKNEKVTFSTPTKHPKREKRATPHASETVRGLLVVTEAPLSSLLVLPRWHKRGKSSCRGQAPCCMMDGRSTLPSRLQCTPRLVSAPLHSHERVLSAGRVAAIAVVGWFSWIVRCMQLWRQEGAAQKYKNQEWPFAGVWRLQ